MDFEQYRPLLFSIAYRMLGTVADAEDMVQEAYLRLGTTDASVIESPRAYMSTIVTRLCIDHLRSARVRHEVSAGMTLLEPIAVSAHSTLDAGILAESLSIAFLAILRSLGPLERAVFLMHEVFDFDYAEVGRIVGKTPVNCRQIVARARKNLGGRSRFEVDPTEVRGVVERFVKAARDGDLEGLLQLLAPDVVMYADSGSRGARYGRVRNITRPLRGSRSVARFLIAGQAQAPSTITFAISEVNLVPAIVTYGDDRPIGVMSFDIVAHRIQNIFIQADSLKLRHLASTSAAVFGKQM
ncbi:MAG: sigma-70 family RNA polymerase sigma factor [Candidatus Binataceae bacterium]